MTTLSNTTTNSIFSDLAALRISPDTTTGGTREILSHVPVRKPNKHDFFRVHPSPEMSLATAIFDDKDEREVFFVEPSMREALLGETKPVLLVPFITRQGVVGIWPITLPGDGGRRNDWHETARDAAERGKT